MFERMNKVLAVLLFICYHSTHVFSDWEYIRILQSTTSFLIGASVVYLWAYNDLRDSILKHLKSINEIRNIP